MNPEIQKLIAKATEQMEKAISHLESELAKIRAGKASPNMLDSIQVDCYGAKMPLNQTANVNTLDSRTLAIQPWDKSLIDPIMKAIQAANIGLNPQNDSTMVRIVVPPLTEERRKDLVKKTKTEGENCKVSLRAIRRDINEAVKALKKNGLPEDEGKEAEAKIQQLTDAYSLKSDKHLELKEKEIMTV